MGQHRRPASARPASAGHATSRSCPPASARLSRERGAHGEAKQRVLPWNVDVKLGSKDFSPRSPVKLRGHSPAGLTSYQKNTVGGGVKICGHLMGEYPPAHKSGISAHDLGLSPQRGKSADRTRPARRPIQTMHCSTSMGAVMRSWKGAESEPRGHCSRKGLGGVTKWLLPTDPVGHRVMREEIFDHLSHKGAGQCASVHLHYTDPITHQHVESDDGHGHWVRKARGQYAPESGTPITPDWTVARHWSQNEGMSQSQSMPSFPGVRRAPTSASGTEGPSVDSASNFSSVDRVPSSGPLGSKASVRRRPSSGSSAGSVSSSQRQPRGPFAPPARGRAR